MSMKTIVAILLIAGLSVAGLSSSALAGRERSGAPTGLFQEEEQAQQVLGLGEGNIPCYCVGEEEMKKLFMQRKD